MIEALKSLLHNDSGISAVEYALMLALIGAGLAAAMLAFGDETKSVMDTASERIAGGG